MFTVLPASHFFFFNDTATTEIYTLSLHDALPIFAVFTVKLLYPLDALRMGYLTDTLIPNERRSEEHTSELQSRPHLVCRLLLEKKNSTAGYSKAARGSRAGSARHARRRLGRSTGD